MSERQGQGQGNQPPKPQTYVVQAEFTDDKGKTWNVGSVFSGDAEAVRKAMAAGKIVARQEPEPEPKPA